MGKKFLFPILFFLFCIVLLGGVFLFLKKKKTPPPHGPRLLRHVREEDIVFYEDRFDFSHDVSNVGYNIGDLLNIPYLADRWGQNPYHEGQTQLDRMYVIARICKGSILERYVNSRPTWEPIPNVERICKCTDEYIRDNIVYLKPILNLVNQKDTLTVHIRTGDMRMDDNFIENINSLAEKFDKVVLLSGIHLDTLTLDHRGKVNNFLENTNSILKTNPKMHSYIDIADVHICMMRKASHLLVYRGGFSGIGAIVAQGKVYATPRFYHADVATWKKHVPKDIILI